MFQCNVVVSQGSQGELTWKTDLDSAEDTTLTNAPGRLLQLAEGASNDVNMMENSFMAMKTPGISLPHLSGAAGCAACAAHRIGDL